MAGKIYICDRTCQVNGIRYEEGVELVVIEEDIVPCPACDGTGEQEAKPCRKCRGTKRSIPPHHFIPKDQKELEVKKQNKDVKQEIDDLRNELVALGGTYHHKTGKAKLEADLILLKRGTKKEGKTSEKD